MLDLGVVVAYLAILLVVSLRLSGRQVSSRAFLLGEGDLPWWSVCLSIVATETSTLTVLSVPGIAYGHGLVFVGLGIGYLFGRVLVAIFLLPLYARHGFVSAYQYLGQRFGRGLQRLAAATFLLTRLLAEAVRLAAAALPVAALLAASGLAVDPLWTMAVLSVLTAFYTLAGGVRAVVWSDSLQFGLYAGGALLGVVVLVHRLGFDAFGVAAAAGRLQTFERAAPVLSSPYAPLTALVGGAALSMASHGADQLMVQRVLACRSLRDARRALVASAVVVTALFAVLSLVGVLLWVRDHGTSLAALGLATGDQLYPRFIVDDLPAGLSGLLVAGILSATMGSLSAALAAMTASTLGDLLGRAPGEGGEGSEGGGLLLPRMLTLLWTGLLVATAWALTGGSQPMLVLGLGIAGYSYGALLGAFLLGRLDRKANGGDAVLAFVVTLAAMAALIALTQRAHRPIAFPWLVPIGVAICLVAGCGARICRTALRRPVRRHAR